MPVENDKGFTLIELLVAVAIVGILVAVVIIVLDPARQRRRARDAVVIATIAKVAAEARAFAASDVTGVGTFPTCQQLAGVGVGCPGALLQNIFSCPCWPNSPAQSFRFNGVPAGANQFRYTSNGSTSFCISAEANDQSVAQWIRLDTATEQVPVRINQACLP